MLSLNDYNEINYYIQISVNNNLSKSELEQIIKNREYERLDEKTKEKLGDDFVDKLGENSSLIELMY